MGYNLHSACHVCKERVTHLRGKEGITLQAFHDSHSDCIHNGYLVETVSDYTPGRTWVESDAYTDLTDEWWAIYFPELT